MPSEVTGLAKVERDWAGTLTGTVGAVVVSADFELTDSAVSVWMRFIDKCERIHGGSWSGWVTSAGKLSASASGAGSFSITATSTAASRLGITGAIAGSDGATVTAQDAHPDGIYPSIGLLLDVVDLDVGRGETTAGTGYASSGARKGASVVMTVHAALSDLWTIEQTVTNSSSYDAVAGPRILARAFFTKSKRIRLGQLATLARLQVTGTTVGRSLDP